MPYPQLAVIQAWSVVFAFVQCTSDSVTACGFWVRAVQKMTRSFIAGRRSVGAAPAKADTSSSVRAMLDGASDWIIEKLLPKA